MSRARWPTLLPIVLAGAFAAAPAWATWPGTPNVNLPLCTAGNHQGSAAIASDGAGGAFVAWQDPRSGTYDIYAQRVNGAGVLVWPAGDYDGVAICTKLNNQYSPMIIPDGAGGAIVTWYDRRRGNAGTDIYAQKVNADGVTQWTPDGVALCTSPNDQVFPTIATDGAGGAFVTWQDLRSGTNTDIYAQRIDAAGMPQWTLNGVPLCTVANNQQLPTITSDEAGGAIVAWQDARTDSAGIFAQRIDAAGVAQWTSDGVAVCIATNDQQGPVIASDGQGGAIVSWEDRRSGTADIYAQHLISAGAPQWTTDGVALCTTPNDQIHPTIIPDGAGGAIVTWQDQRVDLDIYAQRVSAAGVTLWTLNGVALCAAPYDQYAPVITSDLAGGAIVSWFDRRSGGEYDIYAQRVDAAGSPQWIADGIPISTAAFDQASPAIVSDMAGGAIIAWTDGRGADNDIYAQNVNPDGTLGGTLLSVPLLSVATKFALHSVQPNPSFGELRVSFSLFDGTSAMLELFDLTGRRIDALSVGGLGAGSHVSSLTSRAAALRPGVYCVSLTQGTRRAFSKVAIVR